MGHDVTGAEMPSGGSSWACAAEVQGPALRSPGVPQSTQGSDGLMSLPASVLSPGNQRKYIVPASQTCSWECWFLFQRHWRRSRLINVASSEFQGQVHKNWNIKAGQNAAPLTKAAFSSLAPEPSLGTPSKVKAMMAEVPEFLSVEHEYTLRRSSHEPPTSASSTPSKTLRIC